MGTCVPLHPLKRAAVTNRLHNPHPIAGAPPGYAAPEVPLSTQGILRFAVAAFAAFIFAVLLLSQEPTLAARVSTVVPPLVRFQGSAPNRAGDTVEAVFRVYSASEGGEPMWTETQQVRIGSSGTYSALLGIATEGGIPPELFASGQALWLGVSIERAPESPRTILASVAYAMKAADADSVGGIPAGQLATRAQMAALSRQVAEQASFAAPVGPTITGGGISGVIPMWTSTSALGSSALFQGGTASAPMIGVSTKSPVATLDVAGTGSFRGKVQLSTLVPATASAGVSSPMLAFVAASQLSSPASSIPQTFAWQAVPAANNTANPSAKLSLLYAYNTAPPTPTGLSIAPSGILSFAPGQTFPGSITSITAGTGLTGGGTSGNLTLAVDPTVVPSIAASNAFTQSQTFNAGITVNGAGSVNGDLNVKGIASIVAVNPTGPSLAAGNGQSAIGVQGNGVSQGVYGSSSAPGYSYPNGVGVAGAGPAGVQGIGSQYGVVGKGTGAGTGAVSSIGVWGISAAESYDNGSGAGVLGQGVAGLAGYGSSWGVVAVSTGTTCCGGVYGSSTSPNGFGVYGNAPSIGVQATGTGASSIGLNASSPNVAIKATNSTDFGSAVHAISASPVPSSLLKLIASSLGPLNGVAVWADSSKSSSYYMNPPLAATAMDDVAAMFFNKSTEPTVYSWNFGTGSTGGAVPVTVAGSPEGSCVVNSKGDSLCTGAHAAAVSVQGGSRQVAMFAVHAPENWFEDFGSAQLVHGVATVTIEPAFAETINGAMEYHVFLTPNGDCEGLYISRKSPTTFEVRELRGGHSNIAFDYRITARRAGQESTRLPDVTNVMTATRRPAAQ